MLVVTLFALRYHLTFSRFTVRMQLSDAQDPHPDGIPGGVAQSEARGGGQVHRHRGCHRQNHEGALLIVLFLGV